MKAPLGSEQNVFPIEPIPIHPLEPMLTERIGEIKLTSWLNNTIRQ
jgi:hypothetical protein